MAGTKFDLALVIKAVDKATEPLRKINERMREFTAPVRKLNNSIRAFGEEAGFVRLGASVKGVGKAFASVGKEAFALGAKVGGLAIGAGIGLYAIVHSAVEAGDALGELSQRVGLSADAYAQLRYAAAQADVEQEQFAASMDQFNKQVGMAAAGSGKLYKFLQNVAPTYAAQIKGAKGTDEALAVMVQMFSKIKDPARRAALASLAFGASNAQMGQFLGQGSEELDKQRAKFLALAGSQNEFAARAGVVDNALRDTATAFAGMRNAIMAKLFPAIVKITEAVTAFMEKHRDAIIAWAQRAADAIMQWVEGGGIDRLIATLSEWSDTLGEVIDALGGFKTVAIGVAAIMAGPLLLSLTNLIGALWSLGSTVVPMVVRAFMLLLPAMGSAVSAIMAFNFAPIIAGFTGMAASIWAALAPLLPFLAAAIGVGAAIYAIVKNSDELAEAFTTWTGALNMFKAILDLVIAPLESLKTAGEWWAKQFGFGSAKQALNAGTAVAPATNTNNAAVRIEIPNLPKGARVTTDPASTAPVELDLGYSMVGGP